MNDFIQLDNSKKWNYVLNPNAQITSIRGGGKTIFLFYLILSFAEKWGSRCCFLLDGKGADLLSLGQCFPENERKQHVATSTNQIAQILRNLVEDMELTYQKYFQTNNQIGSNWFILGLKPKIIIVDEVLSIMTEDKKIAKEIEKYLKTLIVKGRQSGHIVILSSQKLSADTLDSVIRENCGLRVALSNLSDTNYQMALGYSSKELPRANRGVGKGYVYLDGEGWDLPKAYNAPYIDTNKVDIKKIFLSYM